MRPVLYQLPDWFPLFGGMPLYSYGMMLGLSFVFGCALTMAVASRDGYDHRVTRRILIFAVAGAVVGARLLFLIVNPDLVDSLVSVIGVRDGGLVAHGGMLGGILGAAIACRVSGVSFWRFSDHAAPTLALGLGLTRIGCFLNGCCFGRVTDGWAGVCFPAASPAFLHQLDQGMLAAGADASVSVHPAQLYASLNGFLGLALLVWLYRRRRFSGQVMLVFLLWYGVTRFALEFIRDDPQRGRMFFLSTSQFTSLVAVSVGLGLYWWRDRRARCLAYSTRCTKVGDAK